MWASKGRSEQARRYVDRYKGTKKCHRPEAYLIVALCRYCSCPHLARSAAQLLTTLTSHLTFHESLAFLSLPFVLNPLSNAMADQRQRIIASVFSRRNAEGNLEETYVAHIKIWEDAGPEGGGRKPRYILLSRMFQILPLPEAGGKRGDRG